MMKDSNQSRKETARQRFYDMGKLDLGLALQKNVSNIKATTTNVKDYANATKYYGMEFMQNMKALHGQNTGLDITKLANIAIEQGKTKANELINQNISQTIGNKGIASFKEKLLSKPEHTTQQSTNKGINDFNHKAAGQTTPSSNSSGKSHPNAKSGSGQSQ